MSIPGGEGGEKGGPLSAVLKNERNALKVVLGGREVSSGIYILKEPLE